MKTPQNLFLDIETIPKGDRDPIIYPNHPRLQDIKTGNRKAETALAYQREKFPEILYEYKEKCKLLEVKAEEKYKKRALESLNSTIICLAYAFDDEDPEILTGSEQSIIYDFKGILDDFGDKRYSIRFVGHNIREFDLKFIYHRSMLYHTDSLTRHLNFMTKDLIFDTIERWGFQSYRDYTSLNDILEYLGKEGKTDIDGSKIFDLYNSGELDLIYNYCKKDVEDTRFIFNSIQV